ncbi:hypothetical protein [Nakamurella lactea]|uniref:hypothetical protein n=1 Tax=Nakamurella lactea TaxID=459515 RepID=UPI00041B796D|nr:hypothetical protein [Nakamurella lactea]
MSTEQPTMDELIAEEVAKLAYMEAAAQEILDGAGTPRLRAKANATLERVRRSRRKLLGPAADVSGWDK